MELPADGRFDHLLQADRQTDKEALVEKLIARSAPLVRAIIARRMQPFQQQEGEDAFGDVMVRLMRKLRQLLDNPEDIPIRNFEHYVAEVTRNRCNEYIRVRHPEWWRLKSRVRYLLSHRREFRLWETQNGQWLCALAAWSKNEQEQDSDLAEICSTLKKQATFGAEDLSVAVHAILKRVKSPLELDKLVTALPQIGDFLKPQVMPPENIDAEIERIRDPGPTADLLLEQHGRLQKLWAEICELPLNQRTALLLNLKDERGGDVIALLPFAGIASVRQIAAALNIEDDEFARLWNELPLSDSDVATRMNLSRQQVINLRKSARERLGRRLKMWTRNEKS